MPVKNLSGTARTVHAYVAEMGSETGAAGMGVAFFDARGRVLSTVERPFPRAVTREPAAFRGILLALWTARRLGARGVIVHCDNPAVVRQITGEVEVGPALVGPYLQVRALLHAYRTAQVLIDDVGRGREALALAAATRARGADMPLEDLPLWEHAAGALDRFTGSTGSPSTSPSLRHVRSAS